MYREKSIARCEYKIVISSSSNDDDNNILLNVNQKKAPETHASTYNFLTDQKLLTRLFLTEVSIIIKGQKR
jgi:hypothetical protein